MAASLIDLSDDLPMPDFVSNMSDLLGEAPALTRRAMDLVAASLIGAVYQTASTSAGVNTFIQFLNPAGSDSDFPSAISRLFRSGNLSEVVLIGEKLLAVLLGSNVGRIVSLVASTAGVSDLSASVLLHLGSPLILVSFSKVLPCRELTSAALTNFFASQWESSYENTSE